MVVGRTGVNGNLVLKPVAMVDNDAFVRVQIHHGLEGELPAQAHQLIFNRAMRAHVLVCFTQRSNAAHVRSSYVITAKIFHTKS